MRGLYAILDVPSLGARSIDVVAAGRAVASARPACVQLRAKGLGAKQTLALLRELRPIMAAAQVRLFVNDRPDLALLSQADGVHLGQDDVPPDLALDVAARAGRRLLVGRSTHTEGELDAALAEPIDYLAIGPVFATSSKADHEPVLGLERARSLARRAKLARPSLPVCAIGGIGVARARSLAADFDLVAVIGALVEGVDSASGLRERARELSAVFEAAPVEATP